ncbi:hypothetical protein CIL05_07205 [Virgibacillus profundi]|uniref:Integrase n=1 Tax=Virgibacillus profundi TaxID=2024555 RepID=A0A2A2IFU9_9BACI|nr:site-specific integrase [Virgibacillus profundi]PAV30248.1 hypothetical protein CIL05_07205 [Virgibacillus profundi]PXY54420.1 hypothetical protein CIT14_07290 [Virgibacillus profundi]
MLAEKVVPIKNENDDGSKRGFNTEVYDQIMRFIRDFSRSSENTGSAYERDIRNFFLKTRDKQIEHLIKNDLEYTIEEFEDYYAYLIDERKVSIVTANRYIGAISECIKHLRRRRLINDISFLDIKKHSGTTDRYGILTLNEVEKMAELASKQGRGNIGRIKQLMILFALDTCARRNDCLTIKWSNFTVNEHDVGIHMIGKGNKDFKPSISKEFYNELLTLKQSESEFVFNIHVNTVNRMMDDLRRDMNIPKERNIVFHSFKKTGVQFIWKKTGDINQARKAANHSSIKTTDIYINREENYGIMGAISSGSSVDEELFEGASHEELLKAIRGLGKDQQMYINLQLNKQK